MQSEQAMQSLTDQVRELLTLLESCPTPDITHLRSRIEDTSIPRSAPITGRASARGSANTQLRSTTTSPPTPGWDS